MDILLLEKGESTQVIPKSIHGMLWLQTHFEEEFWEPLACNQVMIPIKDITYMSKDAEESGLFVNYVSSFSIK
tara:strand:+ start:502 stop:720 length:219 start_codon:yes stop_codon:yes gene_type:complete